MNSTNHTAPSRITKDAFFYSCQQSFEARLKKNSFDSHLRFEPFLLQTYELPKAPSAKTFTRELTEIFKHQHQKTPQFKRNDALTLDNSAWFTQAIATLLADVSTLLKFYTNQPVPSIPNEPVEFSDARPVIGAAIAKWTKFLAGKTDESPAFVLFPIEEGLEEENAVEAKLQPAVFAAELWDLLVHNIESTFCSDHAQLILEFFDWNFKPTSKLEKPIDWRIRPPVGELFYQYQKSMGFVRERTGRFDKKDGRGGGRNKDRDDDKPRRERAEESSKGNYVPKVRNPDVQQLDQPETKPSFPDARESSFVPQQTSAERVGPNTSGRNQGRHSGNAQGGADENDKRQKRYTRDDAAMHRRERPHREKPERVEFEDNKQALEHLRMKAIEQNCLPQFEAAIAEVNTAAAQFKSDGSLMKLSLAPQNPFIRRAQHSFAIEQGFETESTGEGRDRCVGLKRKP